MANATASRYIAAGLAAAAVLALATPHADARGWSFRGPRSGPWNHSVTNYNNGGGNFGRTVTTTRPDGQTATSSFNRSVSNGTITDSHTYTGFNGRTASGTLTRTPGKGATATYTARGGQTYSATTTPYHNGNGNFGRTTTTTGPAGTGTRQFSQTNNGNGTYTDSRTVTEPNGQTYSNSYTRY
ncbi:MAG TPA: hypothetical protein VMB34_29600 [Acetobacteraceae bacterium]|nr:hypothetical protein [Acetobacteraceae bacterium]